MSDHHGEPVDLLIVPRVGCDSAWEKGFSRKARAGWCHAACRTRARSRLKPARPYMLRFKVLSRLIWASAGLVARASRVRPARHDDRAVG